MREEDRAGTVVPGVEMSTTVASIAAFLEERGSLRRLVTSEDVAAQPVAGVAADLAAGPAELAWTKREQNWWTFRGLLLLAPPADPDLEDPYVARAGRAVAECENARLAMALVVDRFFAHLAADRPPEFADPAIAAEAGRLGAWVMNARLGAGVRLGPGCVIGSRGAGYERDADGHWVEFPQVGGVVIEDEVHIGAQAVVQRGTLGDTVIRRGTRVGTLANISHNALVAEDVLIVGHAQIGGGVQLERGVVVWQGAVIANGVHVGEDAVIGMNAAVRGDVPAGEVWAGNPARKLR